MVNEFSEDYTDWQIILAFSRWRQRTEALFETDCDATLLQFWILLFLQIQQATNIANAANILELNYTTVAETISQLEKRQLVFKASNNEDCRSVTVSITRQGLEVLMLWDKILVEKAIKIWQGFPSSKRKRAFALFCKLGKSANKVRQDGQFVRGDTAFFIACEQIANDYQRACAQLRLPSEQSFLLLSLAHEGPLTPRQLSSLLAKPTYAISKLTHAAHKMQLVEIFEGPSKREIMLSATPGGLQLAHRLDPAITEMCSRRFGKQEETKALLMEIAQYLINQLEN